MHYRFNAKGKRRKGAESKRTGNTKSFLRLGASGLSHSNPSKAVIMAGILTADFADFHGWEIYI
jgi:hypothetical protein